MGYGLVLDVPKVMGFAALNPSYPDQDFEGGDLESIAERKARLRKAAGDAIDRAD